jgi:DNA-binding transcriptional regulator YdaS (Cro superfamily)
MQTVLDRAVELAGTKAKLARIAGVTRNAVQKWKQIPSERVLRIEKALGIPRYEQRPDLYPVEEYGVK